MLILKDIIKKFLLSVILVSVLICPAFAKIQRFKFCSVNVPKNWTAEQQGATLVIKSNKSNASLSLAVSSMGEASLGDIAKRLSRQLNGENFEKDNDGDYSFTYKDMAGVENYVLITDFNDGRYGLLAFCFENDKDYETISKIMDSIEYHEPDDEESSEEDE